MTCPRCGKELWGVEYGYTHPEHWDGLSEWACPDKECGYRVGRFTGRELKVTDFRLVLDRDACLDDIRAVAGWEGRSLVDFTCETCRERFSVEVPHVHGRVVRQYGGGYMEAYCSEGCAIKAMVEVEA